MFTNKFNLTERSHIAEELLPNDLTDMQRRCMVVQQVVADGDFPLEEALELYEVDPKEYIDFAVHNMISTLHSLTGKSVNFKYTNRFYIDVMIKLQESVVEPMDSKFIEVKKHYKKLSNSLVKAK